MDAQLGDITLTGLAALGIFTQHDRGGQEHFLVHQLFLLLPELPHTLAVYSPVLLCQGADTLAFPKRAITIVGIPIHLVGIRRIGNAREGGDENRVLRITQAKPGNRAAGGGPVGEGLQDMDLRGLLGPDNTIILLPLKSHVQGGALQAVAVDLHNGKNAHFLIGPVKQGIKGVAIVFARLRGGQNTHTCPVAHIVIGLARILVHTFSQVIEFSLFYGQSRAVQQAKQSVGIEIAVLWCCFGVYQTNHIVVAEHRHHVVGHSHGAVVVAAVNLHNPGFILVAHHNRVALAGAIGVNIVYQHLHSLPGGLGYRTYTGGHGGLCDTSFHKGVGCLQLFAWRGGNGCADIYAILVGAHCGVHPAALCIVGCIGVFICSCRKGQAETSLFIFDIPVRNILYPLLYHVALVYVAPRLVLTAGDDNGALVAGLLANIYAGTG